MESKNTKIGPIITAFAIIIVIVVALLYILGSRANKTAPVLPENSSVASSQILPVVDGSSQTATSVQPIIGTDDDLQSIQNDLNQSTTGMDSQNF
ncbi:MAG: hypothetical protein WCP09_03145 [Candidatus Taylorbacteria bacterium]